MSLFRREALEHQRVKAYGEILLSRPFSFLLLSSAAGLIAVAVIVYLCCGEYTQKAHLSGVLVPEKGLVKLYPTQGGRILKINVREGQSVEKGDVLFVFGSERIAGTGSSELDTSNQISGRRASLSHEIAQREALARSNSAQAARRIKDLERELDHLSGELDVQRRRLSLAQGAQSKFDDLQKAGFASALQVQQKNDELLAQRAALQAMERSRLGMERELHALQSDLDDLPLKVRTEIAGLERELSGIKEQEYASEARLETVVTSPVDGVVTTLLTEVGQTMLPSQMLGSLIPKDAQLEAHLYGSSKAIGFLRPAQKVLLRYQAYPYQKFGQHHGTVAMIARAPLNQSDNVAVQGQENLYRIVVRLDTQTIRAYGTDQALQPGMQLDADVQVDRRRLIEWMFEPILSVTGKW